ncbi:MAG: hypothetical protein BroJett020_02120 [Bacteroidota bacterium]|nr:MAG: hypothetical protein BroJett020_02120 [Bacteroidota bacterium]
MELKEFIKNAITSISDGIIEAQTELTKKGVIVNPERLETGKDGGKILRSDGWRYIQELDFEILISVDEKNAEGGGGKLTVFSFANIGLDSKNEKSIINSNILKFKIPVAFPTVKTPDEYKSKSGIA